MSPKLEGVSLTGGYVTSKCHGTYGVSQVSNKVAIKNKVSTAVKNNQLVSKAPNQE